MSIPARLAPLCETVLGLALISALGALPGQAWGLLNIQPHPLWIVVLAIAVRYGAASGYLAGAGAALTYSLLLWSRPEARFQSMASPEFIQPFLMFVGGALLGELVAARERRLAALEARSREAESAALALGRRTRLMEQVKHELEKELAFQANSASTLCRLGTKLQSLDRPDLHQAIVDAVAGLLEAEACSLYLYRAEQLWLAAGRPEVWPARPHVMGAGHPLIQRAIQKRGVVSLRDRLLQAGPKAADNETLLMAGPLTLPDGVLYGIVVVESIAFLRFTPAAIDRFELVLEWAAGALRNAGLYEAARTKAEALDKIESQTAAWMMMIRKPAPLEHAFKQRSGAR